MKGEELEEEDAAEEQRHGQQLVAREQAHGPIDFRREEEGASVHQDGRRADHQHADAQPTQAAAVSRRRQFREQVARHPRQQQPLIPAPVPSHVRSPTRTHKHNLLEMVINSCTFKITRVFLDRIRQ